MKVSIVIPVYNEKKTILEVIKRVSSVDLGSITKEIIIVDDYSTDGTRDVLKNVKDAKVFFHKRNKGKGAALRTGFRHVTGDITLVQDADLEYDPHDYPKLLKPILDGKTNVVFGSRFTKQHKARYGYLYLGNIFLSILTSIIYFRRITDMETCYKVIKTSVLKKIKLRSQRFDFEPEITAKIIKRGEKIVEVPIWYKCRDFNEGKKISWKDGVKAVWYLIKFRFVN